MATLGGWVRIEEIPFERAPDGSKFRRLVVGARAQLGHCDLAPGEVTRAVSHRDVEELWYVLAGTGELWRAAGRRETIVELEPGVAVTVPPGVRFQFRAGPDRGLALLIATAPPWPGDAEAVPTSGRW